MALDSGASEHVANRNVAPAYAIEGSAGSTAGQNFAAAGDARILNQGQFSLHPRNGGHGEREGKDIDSNFQVAKVTRPLWSVGRICDVGFDVRFTKKKAVITNSGGKMVCELLKKG